MASHAGKSDAKITRWDILWPRLRLWLIILSLIGLSVYLAIPKDFDILNPYGFQKLWEFLEASWHPDLTPEFLALVWDAGLITLSYAILGTIFSLAFGFLGACVTSEVVLQTFGSKRLLPTGIRSLLIIPRSLHEVIWGLLFVNLIGLDPVVGILAIAIPYGAIVAKIFAEILDNTPRQSLQSLLNAGANPVMAIAYGLLPQAKLSLMSYGFYRFECSLRSAAILGIIGAGGLGYQMMLSAQSALYSQLWTLFYGICLLNGSMDLLSSFCRHRLGAPSRFELKRSQRIRAQLPTKPSQGQHFGRQAGIILLGFGATAWAWIQLSPNLTRLWSANTFQQIDQGRSQLWPVSLNLDLWQQLPAASIQTLAMSVVAIAIAGTFALSLAWLAAASLGRPKLSFSVSWSDRIRILLTHGVLLLMRAIPSPIWALVMLYVMRPGILVGAIALGIHNAGVMGRLFAEEVENADSSPVQALKQSGVGRISQVFYGLMLQLGLRFSNYSFYRLEVCLRESLILGLVGAGGLGVLLKEEISNFNIQGLSMILVIFCLVTFGFERVSQVIKTQARV